MHGEELEGGGGAVTRPASQRSDRDCTWSRSKERMRTLATAFDGQTSIERDMTEQGTVDAHSTAF